MISDFHCSTIINCDKNIAISIAHEHFDHNAAQMSKRSVKSKKRIYFKFDFF